MTDRTPVSATRYQHPNWEGSAQGPEMIRVVFSDGFTLDGPPDCGHSLFRAALYGDADLGWSALTITDAE